MMALGARLCAFQYCVSARRVVLLWRRRYRLGLSDAAVVCGAVVLCRAGLVRDKVWARSGCAKTMRITFGLVWELVSQPSGWFGLERLLYGCCWLGPSWGLWMVSWRCCVPLHGCGGGRRVGWAVVSNACDCVALAYLDSVAIGLVVALTGSTRLGASRGSRGQQEPV